MFNQLSDCRQDVRELCRPVRIQVIQAGMWFTVKGLPSAKVNHLASDRTLPNGSGMCSAGLRGYVRINRYKPWQRELNL